MCGSGARWCARADAIFDVPDMHVLEVEIDDQQRLVLTIESGQMEAACPACGALAVGHGRRVRVLHDAPCFARVTLLRWLVRIWRCRQPLCPTQTFTEAHDIAPSRMVLTTRAVGWATSALSWDDTTVSALARQLGVDWHTCWDAVEVEARARTADPARLQNVKTLGVDEHIWRPSRVGVDRAVTIMVDLTRDQAGCLHARLLDAVVGRSGSVYKTWLKAQPDGFVDGVEQAALDPFRGYAKEVSLARLSSGEGKAGGLVVEQGLKDGIGEAALEYAKCLASAVPTALAPFDHLFGRRMPTGLGECDAV
jgi:transposase